ncbi:MAG: OmpA family protein [Granulosicoccus sp.]
MFRKLMLKAAVASVLTLISASALALGDQWYLGVGGGASLLQPNPIDRNIDVEEEQGQVATFFIGRDFDERSSGQLQLHSLGEAMFDSSPTDIATYYAADASVLYRFYDSRDRARPGKVFGASLYGRFGLGFIERDSDLPLNNDSQVYFGAGAGIETYLSNNLALRLESLYHETDVGSATLSLVGRFGGRGARAPALPTRTQFPQAPKLETADLREQPVVPAPTLEQDEPGGDPVDLTQLGSPQNEPEAGIETDTAVDTNLTVESPELPEVYTGPILPIEPPVLTVPSVPTVPLPTRESSESITNNDFPNVEIMADAEETPTVPLSENTETEASTDANTVKQQQDLPVILPTPAPNVVPTDIAVDTTLLPEPSEQSSDIEPLAIELAAVDTDNDGILDAVDQCESKTGFAVDKSGCPVFNGTVQSVQFFSGSAELAKINNPELDQLARVINQYPNSRYRLAAYTDNSGSEAAQSDITRARLGTVVQYLLRQGLSKAQLRNQLELRSFGGSRPAFPNTTSEGRQKNNRIEVIELPDQ